MAQKRVLLLSGLILTGWFLSSCSQPSMITENTSSTTVQTTTTVLSSTTTTSSTATTSGVSSTTSTVTTSTSTSTTTTSSILTTSSTGTASTSTTTTTTSTTTTAGFVREGIIAGPTPGTPNFEDDPFRSLCVSNSDPNLVYVGSEGCGIFKSTDGGNNWTWQRNGLLYINTTPPSYAETYDLTIDPGNNDIVYWAATCSPGPPTGNYPSSHAAVYKTNNGGSLWARKTNGLENASIGCMVIDPSNSLIIYIGANGGSFEATGWDITGNFYSGGIYKSTNSGESWTKLDLPSPSEWSDFWRMIIRSGTIYTLGQKFEDHSKAVGLLKSADGGLNWTKITSPVGTHFTEFDVAAGNPNIIYANDGWPNQRNYKSLDGGTSWASIEGVYAYGPIRVSPASTEVVFFANRETLYRSTDGMASFTAVMTVEGAEEIRDVVDIEFAPSNPGIIYAAAKGMHIYKSTNGGSSFTEIKNLRDFIENF